MKVAVAIITDSKDRILITQRPHEATHGGQWEFPGGKLEANETAEEALIREIDEELGLVLLEYEYLSDLHYDYSDFTVHLLAYHVSLWSGTPQCLEGQLQMKWVCAEEIKDYNFPEANTKLIDKLFATT